MNRHDDPADGKLPVTAELGDEGGSYGDATVQAETLTGVLGNRRVDPKQVGPSGAETPATAPDATTPDAADLVKHATEKSE